MNVHDSALMTIPIPIHANDHPTFINNVRKIIEDGVVKWAPKDIFITRINNWFDSKWVKFSGNVMHEVSVWKTEVTVPPFHPNRVESSELFHHESDSLQREVINNPLHILQESSNNLKRPINSFSSDGLFLWYSGNSSVNSKGSIMGYLVTKNECFVYYLSLSNERNWNAEKVMGLTNGELDIILNESATPA